MLAIRCYARSTAAGPGQLPHLAPTYAAINALELRRQEEADELLRQSQLVAHCERELERLGRVNVYNDVFSVWHDGAFGTISALRLGRLPGVTVEWAEINAALGQVRQPAHKAAADPPATDMPGHRATGRH